MRLITPSFITQLLTQTAPISTSAFQNHEYIVNAIGSQIIISNTGKGQKPFCWKTNLWKKLLLKLIAWGFFPFSDLEDLRRLNIASLWKDCLVIYVL